MRLLVVEDSPLLRKMFGLAFPHQLSDCKPAENGRDAMVKKPWSPPALRAVVQQVIASPTG